MVKAASSSPVTMSQRPSRWYVRRPVISCPSSYLSAMVVRRLCHNKMNLGAKIVQINDKIKTKGTFLQTYLTTTFLPPFK